MAAREIAPELQKLFDEGAEVYSISRLNCINQCEYQAYLSYIEKAPKKSNVWANLGDKIHSALEKCVKDGANESIIKDAIQAELDNLDILDIDFPLDRNGNPTIRNNWIANMTKFAEEFKTPKGKFETEKLVLLNWKDNIWIQGYIDLIRHDKNGSVYILDWKTSSQFDKAHLVEAGRQLVLYALAMQEEGYKVSRVSWIMLKYCITTWIQKNGKPKEKISEWRNYIKDLRNVLEKRLSDMGYDEVDIDALLFQAEKENSMTCLPEELQEQFKTRPYVRDYELTPEVIAECKQYIDDSIAKYHKCGTDEKNFKPCNIEKESFFCASLCDFSGSCKYWKDYCEQFKSKDDSEDEDDLF